MEADNITDADDMADKNMIFRVKFNFGNVTFTDKRSKDKGKEKRYQPGKRGDVH